MQSERARRIHREIEACQKTASESGVYCEPVKDDESELVGVLRGPPETSYANGIFFVRIHLGPNYPFEPPGVKFETKVWHPNVSSETGAICLDILKREHWSPALSVQAVMLSLVALMQSPQPDDPQDAEVAGQMLRDRQEFETTARYWTETFAMSVSDASVNEFESMGFAREHSTFPTVNRRALWIDCAADTSIKGAM